MPARKAPDAFRTISEVADWLGVNAHVLRFWESKFPQIKPVKRAGGRRYYRTSDMELLGGIKQLLHEDGLTIKGAQKVLREKGVKAVAALSAPVDAPAETPSPDRPEPATAFAPPDSAPQESAEEAPMLVDVPPATVPEPAEVAPPRRAESVAGGPEIAPLPGSDLTVQEALDRLAPGQVPADALAPLLERARALRARMSGATHP